MKTMLMRIEHLLEQYPETRGDDFTLVAAYYNDFCEVPAEATFAEVMLNHNEFGLPAFDSIGRIRRKIQEHRADLLPTEERRKARQEQEYKVYDFVKRGASDVIRR